MKIDEIDLQIIRDLWDGRTPYNKIAKKMNLTRTTVRSRVNRLKDNGILQIIGLVDPTAIPETSSAVIFIKAEYGKRKEVVQQVGKLKNVAASTSLTSCHDIIAIAMFNEIHTLKDFISKELTKIEGIETVETAFPIDSVGWQLRYVL